MQQRSRPTSNPWCHRFSAALLGLSIAATIFFVWRRLTPIVVSLSTLTGCIINPGNPLTSAISPGDYWVEARAEELAAFALPGTPPAAPDWTTADERDAAWFAGAGVYRLDADLAWQIVSVDGAQTLDDVVQTWDARR